MKYGVLIDDFAIFHDGYLDLIEEAIKSTDKLLVFIKASESSLDIKHPFTAEEREVMICSALLDKYPDATVHVFYMPDMVYEPCRWSYYIKELIEDNTQADSSIVIFDCNNDKELKRLGYPIVNFKLPVDTQSILERIYESKTFSFPFFRDFIPESVIDNIISFLTEERREILLKEFEFVKKYRTSWATAPYPPIFVTVDSMVVSEGGILVIRRGGDPGKGKIALPGGFLNQDEFIKDACIRELIEETSINLSVDDLSKSICDSGVFDYPFRSTRGRTITHAFVFKFDKRPQVFPADDAASLEWMSFEDIDANIREFYEDHYQIITCLLNKNL